MTTATSTSKRPPSLPTEIQYAAGAGSLVFVEALASAPSAEKKCRTIEMLAYSGGAMDFWSPMYVDFEGMALPSDSKMPILRQHDGNRIAGQATKIEKTDRGLVIRATLFDSEAGNEVASLAEQGLNWQCSIGFKIEARSLQWLDDDTHTATVNGRTVKGPCVIARKSQLKEASAVPLGADSKTSLVVTASIDAHNINLPQRSKTMTEPVKATLAELKAAFPKHREFACEQFEAGATLEAAKAAFADVLQAELATKDEELAKAKAGAPAPAPVKPPNPRQPIGVSAGQAASATPAVVGSAAQIDLDLPADAGPAFVRYREILAAFKREKGLDDGAARQAVAKKFPEIHAAYVSEANGSDWKQFPMQTASGFVRR